MEILGKLVLISGYFLSSCIGLFSTYIIRRYHVKKPLGMQSFLSKVTVLFLNDMVICIIHASSVFILSEIFSPLNDFFSILFTISSLACATSFYILVLCVTVTKYLSIYHGTIVASLKEEAVLPKIAWITMVLSLSTAVFEYTTFTHIRNSAIYQTLSFGIDKATSSMETVTVFLILVNFLTIAFLQCRIEFDHWKAEKSQHFFNQSQEEKLPYKIKILRGLLILGAAVPLLVIGQVTHTGNSRIKYNVLLGFIIVVVIIPGIFIRNHSGMSSLARTSLQGLFCEPIYSLKS